MLGDCNDSVIQQLHATTLFHALVRSKYSKYFHGLCVSALCHAVPLLRD